MLGARGRRVAQLFEYGLRVGRGRVAVRRVQWVVGGVAAADRRGAADAPGVEADHVVAVRQAHEVLAGHGELAHALTARAAEVQQHRAPGLSRGPVTGQGEIEGPLPGPGVVEGDGDLAALEVLRHVLALARRPPDLLVVEARQSRRGGVRGRQPRAQQGQPGRTGERAAPQRGAHGQLGQHRCLQGAPHSGPGTGALAHHKRAPEAAPPHERAGKECLILRGRVAYTKGFTASSTTGPLDGVKGR
ncbi:hypothetical protein QFZ43_000443 [Streptomyces afghaniensis]|nr:hypothetical protein [Streptomyces afghaniensis]